MELAYVDRVLNLWYYRIVCTEELSKITNITQNIMYPDQDSNMGFSKYEVSVLNTAL
jgi:hypothetical protein